MNKFIDHPAKIVSWITLIAMLSVGSYTVIDTSKTVEANQGSIYDIQEYISEQRMANKLMQEIQQQYQKYQPYQNQRQQAPEYESPPKRQPEPYCEWEDDKKWCWDDYDEIWWRAL